METNEIAIIRRFLMLTAKWNIPSFYTLIRVVLDIWLPVIIRPDIA